MSAGCDSIDEVVNSLYAIISGPAGHRPWTRERELFHPLARLMRTGIDEQGRPWIKIMSLSDYIEDVTPFLAGQDFFELEVSRRMDEFGNIAQVRSVYEARRNPADAVAERRGVNLIQLYQDGSRWWVLSILWDNERRGLDIPSAWIGEGSGVS